MAQSRIAVSTKTGPNWIVIVIIGVVAAAVVGSFIWYAAFRGDSPVAPPIIAPPKALSPLEQLQAAADAGDGDALYLLAIMYRNGEGMPLDPAKAFALAKRSAESGNTRGKALLGQLYLDGVGTSVDLALAAGNFEAAAGQGDMSSQVIVGGMYVSGEGVEPNRTRAYKWLWLASTQGSDLARSYLDTVGPEFSSDEIAGGMEAANAVLASTASRNAQSGGGQ